MPARSHIVRDVVLAFVGIVLAVIAAAIFESLALGIVIALLALGVVVLIVPLLSIEYDEHDEPGAGARPSRR